MGCGDTGFTNGNSGRVLVRGSEEEPQADNGANDHHDERGPEQRRDDRLTGHLRQSVGKVAPYLADRPSLEVEPVVAPDTCFNRAECNPDEKTQRREAEDQHWYLAPPSLPGFVVLRCLDGVLWHRVLFGH